MELDLLDSEMLFSRVYTPGLLYSRSPTLGFEGKAPENFFWDVCCPTIMWAHGIGLTIVFSHGIFPL